MLGYFHYWIYCDDRVSFYLSALDKLWILLGDVKDSNNQRWNFHCKHCCFFFVSCRKDSELNSLNSKLEEEQNLVAQLQRKIKELQVR